MSLSPSDLKLLKDMVSLPTAPFCERHVQAFVRDWAAVNGIDFTQDEVGNILLTYKGRGRAPKYPWVLQAHMDHPGFELISRRGRTVQAWFRGSVQEAYFPAARMQFFPDIGKPVGGTVETAKRDKQAGFLKCRIKLDDVVPLARGTLGMWELPAWKKRGNRLSLRVVDDLCGVASILLTLKRLKDSGASRKVFGLLTRAEEVGFVGAISAAKNELIDMRFPILGIEASKAQPNARIGQGAIVRVGDASTVFDPELTSNVRKTARALHRADPSLRFAESLMPGGSCESTGLALLGYRTCAVCLPLGNYHNMGESKIEAEKIDLRDFESMVALLEAVSQTKPDASNTGELKKRLLENHRKRAPLL
ncbi:M20/M25/M40 family metallo-hydrolase [Pontiella agarivorans]|uniref:M20/M25/M40 family metallo-hydrolase n=1 Tax=Pontiella agarivorans TaxID=3038953 RepID=A0ABU5MXT7_9BACT|nr:M20/M25/M40 family metallo-hydrolase [Pontiella agarivorans]MDZ8119031.1 M20/M25/M40 family metallo-hydrolase [Pontiella agarivorans]